MNGATVIMKFLILFTTLISILTVTKPFEMAATAAYGTVLMIYACQTGEMTQG